MDIKHVIVSKSDKGYGASECESVYNLVVSPDTKLHKLATRSHNTYLFN